jgi:hypothetical protein
MVWALAVTETISYGVLYYSFAVFLLPMQHSPGTICHQVPLAALAAIAPSPAGCAGRRPGQDTAARRGARRPMRSAS